MDTSEHSTQEPPSSSRTTVRPKKKSKQLELPPPPQSYLTRPDKYFYDEALGRARVLGRAFAIPLLSHHIEQFLKDKCPEYYCTAPQAGFVFQDLLQDFVPPEARRLAFLVVPFPTKVAENKISLDLVTLLGVVIGTNMADEDIEQAENQELVKKTQEGLGVTTPPAWYFFENP